MILPTSHTTYPDFLFILKFYDKSHICSACITKSQDNYVS